MQIALSDIQWVSFFRIGPMRSTSHALCIFARSPPPAQPRPLSIQLGASCMQSIKNNCHSARHLPLAACHLLPHDVHSLHIAAALITRDILDARLPSSRASRSLLISCRFPRNLPFTTAGSCILPLQVTQSHTPHKCTRSAIAYRTSTNFNPQHLFFIRSW